MRRPYQFFTGSEEASAKNLRVRLAECSSCAGSCVNFIGNAFEAGPVIEEHQAMKRVLKIGLEEPATTY